MSTIAQEGGTVESSQFILLPCLLQLVVLFDDFNLAAGHAAQTQARLRDPYVGKAFTHEMRSILDTNTFNVVTVDANWDVSMFPVSTARSAGADTERWWVADSSSFLWMAAPAYLPGQPNALQKAEDLENNLHMVYIVLSPLILVLVSSVAIVTADKRSFEQYRCSDERCQCRSKALRAIPEGSMESSSRTSSDMSDPSLSMELPLQSPSPQNTAAVPHSPTRRHRTAVVVPIQTLPETERPLDSRSRS